MESTVTLESEIDRGEVASALDRNKFGSDEEIYQRLPKTTDGRSYIANSEESQRLKYAVKRLREVRTQPDVQYMQALRNEIDKSDARYNGLREGIGRTMAILAHDMRTPLVNVLMGADVVKGLCEGNGNQDSGEKCSNMLEIIKQGGYRIEQLVDEIVEGEKLAEGNITLNREPVNVNELVRITYSQIYHGKEPRIQSDRAEDYVVDGDQHRLTRVIENVLGNAAKYASQGGPANVVISNGVKLDDGRNGIKIAFSDSGPGIPEDELEHVGTMFYRCRQHAREKGTGLGVSITKALVEAHGGRFQIESEVGKGTTVYVTLPLAEKYN